MTYQRSVLKQTLLQLVLGTILFCQHATAATREFNATAEAKSRKTLNKIEIQLLKSTLPKDNTQLKTASSKENFHSTVRELYVKYRDSLAAVRQAEDEISNRLREPVSSRTTSSSDEIALEYGQRRKISHIAVRVYTARREAEVLHNQLKQLLDQSSVADIDSYLGNCSSARRIFDYKGPLHLGLKPGDRP